MPFGIIISFLNELFLVTCQLKLTTLPAFLPPKSYADYLFTISFL